VVWHRRWSMPLRGSLDAEDPRRTAKKPSRQWADLVAALAQGRGEGPNRPQK